MKLLLKSIGTVRGCYGPNKDQFPARMSFFAPDVADAFLAMLLDVGKTADGSTRLGFSDMWRSGESSLAAQASKRGVQAPAFSGHNFGVSFDLDVDYTLKALGINYAHLLTLLEAHGWHCYRRDGQRGSEDWHFNYFGPDAAAFLAKITQAHVTWQLGAEQAIQKRYPSASCFVLAPADIQTALKKLGMYSGDVDGKLGPQSLQGVGAFCRAWKLPEGTGGNFARTLAFVAADIERT